MQIADYCVVFINKSKIHFESKSQQDEKIENDTVKCLSISQRYILKANHNLPLRLCLHQISVYQ